MRTALLLSLIWLPSPLLAARTCHAADEAARFAGKDTCITAHVYDIAELSDGTRFLDTCSPETSDAACRFTIASLPADRHDAGDLGGLRGQEIQIRGVVHTIGDRHLIYLSSARQLHGGAEKFRPNPELLAGFSAEDGKAPVHTPSLSGNHRFSAFTPKR